MLASILISAVSVVLLIYWFRYTCVLLLRGHDAQDREFRESLPDAREDTNLHAFDPLHRALERDYQVLTYLLHHGAGLRNQSIEDRLLILDYRLMRFWYGITLTLAPKQARRALSERAAVVACLTQKLGRHAQAEL